MIAESSPRLHHRVSDENGSQTFKSFNMVGNMPFQFIKETPIDKELMSQNIFRSRTQMNEESTTEGDQLVSEALTAQDDDIVNQIFQKEFFSSSFDVLKSGKFL